MSKRCRTSLLVACIVVGCGIASGCGRSAPFTPVSGAANQTLTPAPIQVRVHPGGIDATLITPGFPNGGPPYVFADPCVQPGPVLTDAVDFYCDKATEHVGVRPQPGRSYRTDKPFGPNFAAVTPNAVATQPPVALVRQVCLPTPTDMTLGVWNFYAGYLYCAVSDANTGGDLVFHQNRDGSFSIVIKGGGHVDVSLMEKFGIASHIATRLYAGLHK